jgi:hypothetical protein
MSSVLLEALARPDDVAASVPSAAEVANLNVFIGAIEFLNQKDLSHPA